MNNFIRCSFLLLSLLVPVIACAQDSPSHPIDRSLEVCIEKDPTTGGTVTCTDLAYKKWDQELNKNYQTLMRKLKPAGKQLLKTAQLNWISFRDNEFKLVDSLYDNLQGTMYIPMRFDAKMQIVKQRALALAVHLDILSESEP